MSLTTSYLIKTSNLEEFLNAIQSARAPETFTHKFLKDLEFTSTNDRLLIGMLKGLGFLTEDAEPTERYFSFLDQSQSGRVLADGIREAYDDLFAIRTDANEMDVDDVRGKLKTLTQGQKSEKVVNQMAATFRALCDMADWSESPVPPPDEDDKEDESVFGKETPKVDPPLPPRSKNDMQLHYNIQLILPESRDPKVYDALFASLRRHLF